MKSETTNIYKVEEYQVDLCNNIWMEGKSCYVNGNITDIQKIVKAMPKGFRGFNIVPCNILDIDAFKTYMQKGERKIQT